MKKETKEELNTLSIFIKTAFFMITLLLVLAVLTSAKTGISFLNKDIMSVLTTILVISLVILGVLALGVIFSAMFMGKDTPSGGRSTLIRDNTLKYEVRDEKGRKRKKTIDITKIDDFLSQYSELYMVKDTRLHKQDKKAKSNANNLIVTLSDGSEISMRKLNNDDPVLYDQICAYLDKIKDKDVINLSFRMRAYAAQEDLKIQGEEAVASMKALRRQVSDKDVKAKIDVTVEKIMEGESKIEDNADKMRRLYDHYLPMLNQIIADFVTLESHDSKIVNITQAKNQLMDTFDLINAAFDSIGSKEESFDELEASVQTANAYMSKENSK